MQVVDPPVALLRAGAVMMPSALLERVLARVQRGLLRSHPKLFDNLARLDPATIHVAPVDLPYRFRLTLGCTPATLSIVERDDDGADARVTASVATLVELLEGRIDGDALFFRRDLVVEGNTAAVVGLRNVLDREEIRLGAEFYGLFGPLRPVAGALGGRLDRLLGRLGARAAALHRAWHPPDAGDRDVGAEIDRCREEMKALGARLAALEARQQRRDEKRS
jgi:O2-independent ubiquinone biosynthesis accessory factor UbiT